MRNYLVYPLSSLLLLTIGCTAGPFTLTSPATPEITVDGNWQITAKSSQGLTLPGLSGVLTGNSSAISGFLHANQAECLPSNESFRVSGAADAQRSLTLVGDNVAGGQLTLTGTLAPDGRSITNATYNIVGGGCAMARPAAVSAQAYSPITGNYAGSFSDADGQVIPLTASLTQTPASDTSGNFQLSGTGTLPGNPCFQSPVQMTNSQVTGGSFTFTYTDPSTNSVTISGVFSPDGTTLTVSSWVLSGPCGPDNGTGLLRRQ